MTDQHDVLLTGADDKPVRVEHSGDIDHHHNWIILTICLFFAALLLGDLFDVTTRADCALKIEQACAKLAGKYSK